MISSHVGREFAGACGNCSTSSDIALYNSTRRNLTKSATECATQYFFGGRTSVDRCFREIGFSMACRECWVENVVCDIKHCVFTCLRHVIEGSSNNARTGLQSKNSSRNSTTDVTQNLPKLSPCLECDEKMCGPAFTTCAGANRRRSGIKTDIERDTRFELCNLTAPSSQWFARRRADTDSR